MRKQNKQKNNVQNPIRNENNLMSKTNNPMRNLNNHISNKKKMKGALTEPYCLT